MASRPFVDHVGIVLADLRAGHSRCTLAIEPQHFNTAGIVHGGALFSLADTAMGAALYAALPSGQGCATVEIKINYFRPVVAGQAECIAVVVNQGRTLANVEGEIRVEGRLVAKANGTFAIFAKEPR